MKKSKYSRTTKELRFNEIHPQFVEYLKEYAEIYSFNAKDLEISRCFETTNTYKGFFGKQKENYTIVCFSKKYLFWGIIDPKKKRGVAAVKWDDIEEVCDWEKTAMGKIYEESGIEIYGTIYNWTKRSRWFIGLGNDEGGRRMRKLLLEITGEKYRVK